MQLIDDNKKIGIVLLLISLVCFFFGMLLIFDRSLFIIGNIAFFLGLYFLVGLQKTILFFSKKGKIKGSVIFFVGFLVLVIGFSFIGFAMQLWGLFLLFKSFLPFIYDSICRLPVIGRYFSNPTLKSKIDDISKVSKSGPGV